MNITVKEMTTIDYKTAQESFNFEDADADLISAIWKNEKNLYGIFDGDQLAGAAQLLLDGKPYLYLFINPAFRNKGIGSIALKLCEEMIPSNGIEKIITTYRTDDLSSKAFASKYGYSRKFSSSYMIYRGLEYDTSEQIENNVKEYQDEDYTTAHELYATAFHEMRLSVGDFPDSIIEQPTENMRNYWSQSADERFVYLQDNTIVGYAHIEGNEIGSVSVHRQYQGQGIGRNFVKHISNKILKDGNDTVSLYCVVGNKARKLYDSLGFQEVYTIEYAIKMLY